MSPQSSNKVGLKILDHDHPGSPKVADAAGASPPLTRCLSRGACRRVRRRRSLLLAVADAAGASPSLTRCRTWGGRAGMSVAVPSSSLFTTTPSPLPPSSKSLPVSVCQLRPESSAPASSLPPPLSSLLVSSRRRVPLRGTAVADVMHECWCARPLSTCCCLWWGWGGWWGVGGGVWNVWIKKAC